MTGNSDDPFSERERRDLRIELAKANIREAIYRYCRGVDHADQAIIASAFHDWAYEEHGPTGGSAHAFAAESAAIVPDRLLDVQHLVGNILIDVDGDVAFAESYVVAAQRRRANPEIVGMFGGRYLDRFERHGEEWKIARRTVVNDWTWRTGMPPDALTEQMFPRGRRDREDPVFLASTWAAKRAD